MWLHHCGRVCQSNRQGWMASRHGWSDDSTTLLCTWKLATSMLYNVNPPPTTPRRVYRSSGADIFNFYCVICLSLPTMNYLWSFHPQDSVMHNIKTHLCLCLVCKMTHLEILLSVHSCKDVEEGEGEGGGRKENGKYLSKWYPILGMQMGVSVF